jgi:hypothetical protein
MEAGSRKLCIGGPKVRLEVRDGHGEVLICVAWLVTVELWVVMPIEDDTSELGTGRWTWSLLALKDADYHANFNGSLDAILE